MRTLAEIDAERAELEARLYDLQVERDAARQMEIDEVVRLFDAGLSFKQIGRQTAKTSAAVQGIIFRSSRTVAGRAGVRHQIAVATAQAAP